MAPNKLMHQTGALVLEELILFVRSLVPGVGQLAGPPLRSRLQVMGKAVRQRRGFGPDPTLPARFNDGVPS